MGTVFTKLVSVNAPDNDVVFDGCDFTQEALVRITAAKSVTFKNCRFYGWTPTSTNTHGLRTDPAASMKLTIENCFFGDNPTIDGKRLYNLIELQSVITDGSSISNNWFALDCCTHNQINFYQFEDNSNIRVNGNHFVDSKNGVRIGPKGAPENVNVVFSGNAYDSCRTPEDWAGLMIVQPYGKSTVSMNGITLDIRGTVNNSGMEQLFYLYDVGDVTKFEAGVNLPTIYVDGVQQDLGYAPVVEEPEVDPIPTGGESTPETDPPVETIPDESTPL